MRLGSQRVSITLSCLLGLTLITACGGGGSGGGGGNTVHFDSGTGFDANVLSIVPALDGSGDIYVGGDFTQYNGATANHIARLNRDGSLDSGFATDIGFNDSVFSVVPINDGTGDIYAGGSFSSFRGNGAPHIARVKPDGTEALVDFGTGFSGLVRSLAPATDGSGDLYAGGNFTGFRGNDRKFVARANSDGSNDAGFDTGTGFDVARSNEVWAIAVANDGSGDLYVGGKFSTYRGNMRSNVVRINSDGSNDGGFAPVFGFNRAVNALAVANDGSGDLYAGGRFGGFDSNLTSGIARINSDGTNDAAFATGDGFDIQSVFAIATAVDGSGDVYVGGYFNDYKMTSTSMIARLNSDGSLDTGFAIGSGFDGDVYAIAVATDGSGDVFVGGNFNEYNGTPVGKIVRLNADGSLD